jgi:hypothetical protein
MASVSTMEPVLPKPVARESDQLAASSIAHHSLPTKTALKPNEASSQLVVLPEAKSADHQSVEGNSARITHDVVAKHPERLQPVDLSELYADTPDTIRTVEIPYDAPSKVTSPRITQASPRIPQAPTARTTLKLTVGPAIVQNTPERGKETTASQNSGQTVELRILSQQSTDKPAPDVDLSDLYADSLSVFESVPTKTTSSQPISEVVREAQPKPNSSSQQPSATTFTESQPAAPDLHVADSSTELTPLGLFQRLARVWTSPQPAAIPAGSESQIDLAGPGLLENPEEKYVSDDGGTPTESHLESPRSLTNPEAQYVDDVPASVNRKHRLAWAVRILKSAPKGSTNEAEERDTKRLVNPVGYLLRRSENRAPDGIH